jgi:hypothetical protein
MYTAIVMTMMMAPDYSRTVVRERGVARASAGCDGGGGFRTTYRSRGRASGCEGGGGFRATYRSSGCEGGGGFRNTYSSCGCQGGGEFRSSYSYYSAPVYRGAVVVDGAVNVVAAPFRAVGNLVDGNRTVIRHTEACANGRCRVKHVEQGFYNPAPNSAMGRPLYQVMPQPTVKPQTAEPDAKAAPAQRQVP